jgi:hypothetical protein
MSVGKYTWSILGCGVALAFTVTAAPAEEDINSASYMLLHCRDFIENLSRSRDFFEEGVCVGIVKGIFHVGSDLNGVMKLAAPPAGTLSTELLRRKCLGVPAEVTVGQMVRVVIAYIEARPARMHEPFGWLALEALRTAWPCE